MIILQNDTTWYGFQEDEVLEWCFNFTPNVEPVATLLFKNGYKRTITGSEALQALEVFQSLYTPSDVTGVTEDSS